MTPEPTEPPRGAEIARDREREADAQVQALLRTIPVRKVLTVLFIFAAIFISFEAFLIICVLPVEGLHRMTTLNGSIVIVGGLCWACIFTFVFVWPMKVLNIEGLRLTFSMRQDMREWASTAIEAKKAMAELLELVSEVKPVLSDVKALVELFRKRDFDKVEQALSQIVAALGEKGEVTAMRSDLAKAVSEFGEIVEFMRKMKGDVDRETPQIREKLTHFAKTLDALADYLDIRVG